MNVRRVVFSLAAVCLIAPVLVLAAGLVPCGGASEAGAGLDSSCQMCHVITLMNNVVRWLVGILSVAASIMFVIAGYRLVTAGGNPSTMKAAKDMLVNVAIGFTIVLAAWLLIDLMMKSLLGGTTALGPWNVIQCLPQPNYTTVANRIGLQGGGGGITSMQCDAGPGGNTVCAAQEATCVAQGGTSNIDTTDPANYTVRCSLPASNFSGGSCGVVTDTNNACNPSNLSCFGNANAASQVCNLESAGGRTDVMSGSDLCRDGNSFSGGLWQINVLAHCDRIPGCNCNFFTKNGSSAQGDCVPGQRKVNSNGVPYCAVRDCQITNQATYQSCVASVRNATINSNIACDLYSQAGGWQPWVTSATACNVN